MFQAVGLFCGIFLAPLAQRTSSYVRDSPHVISRLHGIFVPSDAILSSMDIISLYANIPTEDGIAAVSHAFTKHAATQHPDLPVLIVLFLL